MLLEVMNMPVILIIVMVLYVYAYVQTHRIVCIKYIQFLCINYTSIYLFENNYSKSYFIHQT